MQTKADHSNPVIRINPVVPSTTIYPQIYPSCKTSPSKGEKKIKKVKFKNPFVAVDTFIDKNVKQRDEKDFIRFLRKYVRENKSTQTPAVQKQS